MAFDDVLCELYRVQECKYPVWIDYDGIDHRVKAVVDVVKIQNETFGTDNPLLFDGMDINRIKSIERVSEEERYTSVSDIIDLGIEEFRKKAEFCTGDEKYVDVVIYDDNGLISDTPIERVSAEILNKEAVSWGVTIDPHDVDSLILEIQI